MNVSLTPHLEAWVQEKVATGRYGNASEVVRDALRLMQERDQEREARLRDLRQAVQEGIDSGPSEPLDMREIKRTARAEWEARQTAEQV